MAEEQAISTSTGVTATPAAGEGGQPAAPPAATSERGDPGAPAAPTGDDLKLTDREKAFLSGLKDERDKRQQIEQELSLLRANMAAVPAQPAAPAIATQPAAPTAPAAPADPLADIDDDDLLTGKDIKAKVVPMFMGLLQQVAGAIAVQQRQAQFSDVTTEDIKTLVPKVIQEDPALGQVMARLPGPAQFIVAQTIARFAKKAASSVPPTPGNVTSTPPTGDPLSDIARAILANVSKPAAPGTGGGGAMDDVVSLLRNMSPEQYEAYRAEKKKAMGL